MPEVAVPISTMVAQAPQEKTLKEILEERETELKELEQLEVIQDKGYMEALVEDIETKPSAQPAAAPKKAAPLEVDEDGTPVAAQPD